MNELAMNFATKRVYDRDLKFLIVPEASVAHVLRKLLAMEDSFSVILQFKTDTIPHRNAVFHVKEKGLHGYVTRFGIGHPSGISGVTAFPRCGSSQTSVTALSMTCR
jgi:hypothetical protein